MNENQWRKLSWCYRPWCAVCKVRASSFQRKVLLRLVFLTSIHHPKRQGTNKGWDTDIEMTSGGCSCRAGPGKLSSFPYRWWCVVINPYHSTHRCAESLSGALLLTEGVAVRVHLSSFQNLFKEGKQQCFPEELQKLKPVLHSLSLWGVVSPLPIISVL